jgi:hypothetical protein
MAGFGEKAALKSGVTSLAGFEPAVSRVTSLAAKGVRLLMVPFIRVGLRRRIQVSQHIMGGLRPCSRQLPLIGSVFPPPFFSVLFFFFGSNLFSANTSYPGLAVPLRSGQPACCFFNGCFSRVTYMHML